MGFNLSPQDSEVARQFNGECFGFLRKVLEADGLTVMGEDLKRFGLGLGEDDAGVHIRIPSFGVHAVAGNLPRGRKAFGMYTEWARGHMTALGVKRTADWVVKRRREFLDGLGFGFLGMTESQTAKEEAVVGAMNRRWLSRFRGRIFRDLVISKRPPVHAEDAAPVGVE
jgi:hypothetical protein